MNKKRFLTVMILVVMILALFPTVSIAKKGPPTVELSNNLSFPVVAVDGFAITPLTTPAFTTVYSGDYSGLTVEEITALTASGPWYPQKTTGNVWQADYSNNSSVTVYMIDWSDNIESINPKVRTKFRLEIVLYATLPAETTMTGYTMAVFENPSSADELQGTNNTTYESDTATVISTKPALVVQYLGTSVPELTWVGSAWQKTDETIPQIVPVSFAPELNVGGKYIFGASEGGWTVGSAGYYRITFYIPTDSTIELTSAAIGNMPTESKATAVVDTVNNLTYIDVLAVGKR